MQAANAWQVLRPTTTPVPQNSRFHPTKTRQTSYLFMLQKATVSPKKSEVTTEVLVILGTLFDVLGQLLLSSPCALGGS